MGPAHDANASAAITHCIARVDKATMLEVIPEPLIAIEMSG
jgi:hypothetical protein